MNKGKIDLLFLGGRPLSFFLESRTTLVERRLLDFDLFQILQEVLLPHNFHVNVIDTDIVMSNGRAFRHLGQELSFYVRLEKGVFVLGFFNCCVDLEVASWTHFIDCLVLFKSDLCSPEALVLRILLCLSHHFVLDTQLFSILIASGSWLVFFLERKIPLLCCEEGNVGLVVAFLLIKRKTLQVGQKRDFFPSNTVQVLCYNL